MYEIRVRAWEAQEAEAESWAEARAGHIELTRRRVVVATFLFIWPLTLICGYQVNWIKANVAWSLPHARLGTWQTLKLAPLPLPHPRALHLLAPLLYLPLLTPACPCLSSSVAAATWNEGFASTLLRLLATFLGLDSFCVSRSFAFGRIRISFAALTATVINFLWLWAVCCVGVAALLRAPFSSVLLLLVLARRSPFPPSLSLHLHSNRIQIFVVMLSRNLFKPQFV